MLHQIEHIAIVVQDLEAALRVYRDTLGFPLLRVEEVPAEHVNVAFLQLPEGEGHLELVQPTEAGTGIARFLDKRGEGIHHICFEVDDAARVLAELSADGVQLVDTAARPGAEGKPVAFVHPKSTMGVLVELIQK